MKVEWERLQSNKYVKRGAGVGVCGLLMLLLLMLLLMLGEYGEQKN